MPKRPQPEPFHPPVGISDEVYPGNRRWLILTVLALAALAGSVYAALNP